MGIWRRQRISVVESFHLPELDLCMLPTCLDHPPWSLCYYKAATLSVRSLSKAESVQPVRHISFHTPGLARHNIQESETICPCQEGQFAQLLFLIFFLIPAALLLVIKTNVSLGHHYLSPPHLKLSSVRSLSQWTKA